MRPYFTLFTILLISSAAAQELQPIQTDRPDQTECPFIVPKKYFQAEIGFSYEKIKSPSTAFMLPTCLFKYGISEKTELRLITEIERQQYLSERNTGLNPVTIGFKTKLFEEKGIIPTISFIGHLTFPYVASCKSKNIFYAPSFRFTMQHTISSKISFGYNLGAEWDGFTAEPTFIYTLTTGFTLSDKIGSFIELYGFVPQQSTADHRFDAGISFLINNNILFDIASGAGISSNAASFFIATGFSFRLK